MAYSDEVLSQIKEVSRMEDVAAGYVALKRRGRTYVCLCPFHSEKTPSCHIYPDTDSFFCFGCDFGGDVFTWVQRIENVTFSEAVQMLANRAGIELPENAADAAIAQKRKTLQAINRAAARFFYHNLLRGSDKRGLQYLVSRGIQPKTVQKYGLGFAPNGWTGLTHHLLKEGFSEEDLIDADLSRRAAQTGNVYDMFRNRVIFPIIDTAGVVIGFGGRVLDNSEPKYLNTAETMIFNKGKNLFSLNFAKESASSTLILAEGYMDVIAMYQAGFANVVATLGTAITADQARELAKYAKKIIIAYDSDTPGQTAARRAVNRFYEVGLPTEILHIPNAKDPDEYIKKFGAGRFQQLLDHAEDAVKFLLESCADGLDANTESGRVQILRRVAGVLADIENRIQRDVYIGSMAEKWGVAPDVLRSQVDILLRSKRKRNDAKAWNEVRETSYRTATGEIIHEETEDIRQIRAQERLLHYLLVYPKDTAKLVAPLTAEFFTNALYQKVFICFLEHKETFSLSSLRGVLEEKEMSAVAKIDAKQHDIPFSEREITDCVEILRKPPETPVESDAELESLIARRRKEQA